MRTQHLSAFTLCGALAYCFQDTSPFFAFTSTAPTGSSSHITLDAPQFEIAHSSELSSILTGILEQCPSEAYILVSQPRVSAVDFSSRTAAPHLYRMLSTANETVDWRWTVPEVVGTLDSKAIQRTIVDKCGAKLLSVDAKNGVIESSDVYPQLMTIDFAALPSPSQERASKLLEHDSFLHAVLNNLDAQTYTVLYTTSSLSSISSQNAPKEELRSQLFDHEFDSSFPAVMHTDLKRDLESHIKPRANETNSRGGLFETYAFLSPGIFMGLVAGLLLFTILYVGISAISSLEISVAAFSKEMGPSAQKKQQ